MNGHSVIYHIPAGVKVLGLKYRWQTVGRMAGSFTCDDPFYQRPWDMGRNTLFVCARDNFMDCPDRERALWIGDVADQASYLFYLMDESGRALLRQSIHTTMAFSDKGVFGCLGPLRIREFPAKASNSFPKASGSITSTPAISKRCVLPILMPKNTSPSGNSEKFRKNGLPIPRRHGSADSWERRQRANSDSRGQQWLQHLQRHLSIHHWQSRVD